MMKCYSSLKMNQMLFLNQYSLYKIVSNLIIMLLVFNMQRNLAITIHLFLGNNRTIEENIIKSIIIRICIRK